MSRIDDALRRVGAGPGSAADEPPAQVPPQQAFVPAWPMARPSNDDNDRAAATEIRGWDLERRTPDRQMGVLQFSSEWRERLAGGPEGDAGLIEQFRRLAATLHHAQSNSGIKSIMVSSASPGDGKTLTAVNLALVLAESYRARVLLIDADLRRPSIPSVADLGDGQGLSEALRAATEQKLALVPITPRLTLLPAGRPVANSIEALTSPRMRQILDEAIARFDWVILDAPPVGPTADARLLTQMVGGVLFVIHAGQTQHPEVEKAINALGRDQIIGVVLNGVEPEPMVGYYGVSAKEHGHG
ncbi:MAG: CpsD/CapB family tyrosine-protein kinase [Acidobacteria bacterium]|nr:CpsD/CapB family tyrosine-protein kinase [Acidobacteriota bacterium]